MYAMSLGQSACLRWVFMAAASEVPLLPLRVPLKALYAMTLSPAARLRWGLRLMKPCRLHPPPLSVERRIGDAGDNIVRGDVCHVLLSLKLLGRALYARSRGLASYLT